MLRISHQVKQSMMRQSKLGKSFPPKYHIEKKFTCPTLRASRFTSPSSLYFLESSFPEYPRTYKGTCKQIVLPETSKRLLYDRNSMIHILLDHLQIHRNILKLVFQHLRCPCQHEQIEATTNKEHSRS